MKKKDKAKLKETENNLTAKFNETLQSLGFEADKLKKEVAKAVKSILKKVNDFSKDDKKTKDDKTTKQPKADKNSKAKPESAKAAVKTDKLTKAITKVSAQKKAEASSRSVSKPDLSSIKTVAISDQPQENKKIADEASAPEQKTKTAAKASSATDKTEKVPVKEASASPKKNSSKKTKTGPVENKITSAEVTGSNVLR